APRRAAAGPPSSARARRTGSSRCRTASRRRWGPARRRRLVRLRSPLRPSNLSAQRLLVRCGVFVGEHPLLGAARTTPLLPADLLGRLLSLAGGAQKPLLDLFGQHL